eukprot:TRINITY_DN6851_c0_g1_i1.p1 TRINITY_DN6851_c0_g1~~TRINITY_DN6851_c0_g1_i1.p1  ORF type:complete len:238 (+),score=58.02 TRINITY_DN6851_c0_g1_i1:65-778(+)
MARNEEKAQSMLNRWLAYKRGQDPTRRPLGKRPGRASDIDSVGECERWRMQLIRDIGKKIMEVQNESLGEQRIRDVNDELNKLMREKAHWERRILELGGPNYRKFERIADDDAIASTEPDQKGYAYKYFGAARKLPEVKKLLEKRETEKKKRRREDQRGIDADYYGYTEEGDTALENIEAQAEKNILEQAKKEQSSEGRSDPFQGIDLLLHVPTREQIQEVILAKKKEELLKRYGVE